VLHEFAHQLDGEDGVTDGTPLLPPGALRTWGGVLSEEYERLRQDTADDRESALDEYGATNKAEFFAVATETFFEKTAPARARASRAVWAAASSSTGRIPHGERRPPPMTPSPRRMIDLSHTIEHGMVTYPGLPVPVISDWLSRDASQTRYAPGTTFRSGRLSCWPIPALRRCAVPSVRRGQGHCRLPASGRREPRGHRGPGHGARRPGARRGAIARPRCAGQGGPRAHGLGRPLAQRAVRYRPSLPERGRRRST